MTITQTVEIPVSRRVLLDLPLELPVGRAKITVISEADRPPVNTPEEVESLRGLAKKMGSTLTVERFLEMRKEDLDIEETKYNRFLEKKG